MDSMRHLFLFFLCLYSAGVYSQNSIKWGKLAPAEVKLHTCPFDSSASAIVLADYGKITISGTIVIDRHVRIKILDKRGLEQANVAIGYQIKDNLEEITKIEAQTLTIDKNGNTLVTEVPKEQFFKVDVSANWQEKRFSFPSVEVGSVIEYRFRKISQSYFALDEWFFQRDIPTMRSTLKVEILSSALDYRVFLQGQRLLAKYQDVDEKAVSEWELQDLPALVREPFVANYYDYAEKIHFQLGGYTAVSDIYGSRVEYTSLMNTWEKLGQDVLQHEGYTNYLGRKGIAKDMLEQCIHPTEDADTKVRKIYNFVRDHLQWNGAYELFPNQQIGKLMQSNLGNSAEVNLFLTMLLQEADLEAYPILISTRSHGKVQQAYAQLRQFNHVTAYVKTPRKEYILDATDPLRPYDLVSTNDLNRYGLLVAQNATRWIPIELPQSSKEIIFGEINLSNADRPVYRLSARYEGYEALAARRKFYQLGEEKFLSSQKAAWAGYKLSKFEQEKLTDTESPLIHSYQLEAEEGLQGNVLYIQPVVWHNYTENMFKGSKRNLPVELDYPKTFQFILSIKIPEGYEVQEIPQSIRLALPDKMGQFQYLTTVQGRQLQLLTTVSIKEVFISPYYFSHLQEFYDQIISKYREKVVLRRK